MRPQPPIQTQPFGRTTAIAGAILAVVALCQLGSVTFAFTEKTRGDVSENGEDGSLNPPMKIDVSKLIAVPPPPDSPDGLGADLTGIPSQCLRHPP